MMNLDSVVRKHTGYHRYIVSLMSFIDNYNYPKEQLFTVRQLSQVVPDDVVRWMLHTTLGIHSLDDYVDGMHFQRRSSSLEVMKKAVSWYMPDRVTGWNTQAAAGNPTKSTTVNDILKFVKKMEVRRNALPSKAKDPLMMHHFRAALRVLEVDPNNFNNFYRFTCMMKFQYHLIGRCDDMGNFLIRDIHSHSNPNLALVALQTKVYWSKNVLEERNCPDQILFGSYDVDYCLLLSLGLYLETWMTAGPGRDCQLLFSDDVDNGTGRTNVHRLKQRYHNLLNNHVFCHPYFREHSNGNYRFGSHSIRKYPATFAVNNGCTPDEVERRGRWKGNSRRVVDRYVDVEQQWIDGKVGAALCVGGPIRYVLVDGCNVTHDWLFKHVVPGIFSFFVENGNRQNENMLAILGMAVLWACMDESCNNKVPGWLLQNVQTEYRRIQELPDGVNPVERKKLVVMNTSGQLFVQDRIEGGLAGIGGEGFDGTFQLVQMVGQLGQQMLSINENLTNMQNEIRSLQTDFEARFRRMNRNVDRFLRQPAFPVRALVNINNNRNNNTNNNVNDNNNGDNDNNNNEAFGFDLGDEAAGDRGVDDRLPVARLGSPRNLYELWDEYYKGLGGRKAAKNWTFHERGKDKVRYCRRKVFWDVVAQQVRAGNSHLVAIDRIKRTYGENLSVTKILKMMAEDKRNGGHANLQI